MVAFIIVIHTLNIDPAKLPCLPSFYWLGPKELLRHAQGFRQAEWDLCIGPLTSGSPCCIKNNLPLVIFYLDNCILE